MEAKFGLATVLATGGRLNEAIPLLREVVSARPNHLQALTNLGNALLQQRAYRNAEQAFREALKLKPDFFPTIFGLGCALQFGEEFAEAERWYRQALKLQPNDPGSWMNLGATCRQQRKQREAIESFRRVISVKPDFQPGWSALGQTLLEINQPLDAEEAFRRAEQLAPQAAEPHIGIADALLKQQRNDEALEQYLRAIALDPDSQNAHTKTESLLLRMAHTPTGESAIAHLSEDRIYERPAHSLAEAHALLDAYIYPFAEALERTRTLLQQFDPEQIYPGEWWASQLSRLGAMPEAHQKIFRGISSAIYSWSPPSREALQAVATFAADTLLHSIGAGAGYWEWLLARHFGTRVLASELILRHRFLEMAVEDYGTATVNEDETVFLAWIPQGVEAVLNLFEQMRAGQKLVIIGEGSDAQGKARICATEKVFRYIETGFEPAGTVRLGYYSYIHDDVRMYRRR
jgi:tetratricopeptide (TPR) repeat protein